MSTVKLLDVNKLVITPNGDNYCEPKMNRKGQILMDDGTWVFTHQMDKSHTPVYEDKKIGQIMTHVLDKVDEKAVIATIRKRFFLSCRIEQAMKDNKPLKVVNDEWMCLQEALENTKNPLFVYRVQEAIDTAELDKEEVK